MRPGTSPEEALSTRLLAETEVLRQRYKRSVVRERLQQGKVSQHTVRASYGELQLLEGLAFVNSTETAQNFRIMVCLCAIRSGWKVML